MATSKRSRKSLESLTPIATDESAPVGTSLAGGALARNPPLLRKSSSTGLLDAGIGTPLDASQSPPNGSDGFPKLRRKSSSLQDVNDSTKQRRQSDKPPKAKKSARQGTTKRASGWNTPKSAATNPTLPQLSSSVSKSRHSLSAQTSTTNGQPKRSKRAGDVELTRQPTIDVVLKYQRS